MVGLLDRVWRLAPDVGSSGPGEHHQSMGQLNRTVWGIIDRRTCCVMMLSTAETCWLDYHEAQLVGVGAEAKSGRTSTHSCSCLMEKQSRMTPELFLYIYSVFLRRGIVGVPRSVVSDQRWRLCAPCLLTTHGFSVPQPSALGTEAS